MKGKHRLLVFRLVPDETHRIDVPVRSSW
jgi:hypothetical protein